MFSTASGSFRTPTPTTRDAQERVIKLAREGRRCGSAQPIRSASQLALQARVGSGIFGSYGIAAAAGRPPRAVDVPPADDVRPTTPTLKQLVLGTSSDALGRYIADPAAAAELLNGPPSPSRTRVRRTTMELANEMARSRSTSPTRDDAAAAVPPSPSLNLSRSGTAPLMRPASASAAVFHTVGPREFARLKLKMRSQSPWALHVDDDTLNHATIEAARKAEAQAKQALYKESLAAAVEQRRREAEARKEAERAAELESLQKAKLYEVAMDAARRGDNLKKQLQINANFNEFLESQSKARSSAQRQQDLDRFLAQQERQAHLEDQKATKERKKESCQAACAALAAAEALKKVQKKMHDEETQRDLDLAAAFQQVQQQKRDAQARKIQNSREFVETRAKQVASTWRPTRKQKQLDAIDDEFQRTASELLATNVQLNEAAAAAARQRSRQAAYERRQLVAEKEAEKQRQHQQKMDEERMLIMRDKFEKQIYDQTRSEMLSQQRSEVRSQLELQRRIAMKQTIEEVAAHGY